MSVAERFFSQLVRRYGKVRGWNPGGKEWNRRRALQIELTGSAIEMEEKGFAAKIIINSIGERLGNLKIGYDIGTYTRPDSAIKDKDVQAQAIAIFMKHPGMDKTKNIEGFVIWYEGMAGEWPRK